MIDLYNLGLIKLSKKIVACWAKQLYSKNRK